MGLAAFAAALYAACVASAGRWRLCFHEDLDHHTAAVAPLHVYLPVDRNGALRHQTTSGTRYFNGADLN